VEVVTGGKDKSSSPRISKSRVKGLHRNGKEATTGIGGKSILGKLPPKSP
jgi:hypothetical protein